MKLRSLGGMIVWVTLMYCPPRTKLFHGKEDSAAGVHDELVQFDAVKGISQALQSRVARKVALCPSLKLANTELLRDGVQLAPKSVMRIACQSGQQMLEHRKHQLDNWREDAMPVGTELAGHLDYQHFAKLGISIGSDAINSSVRRVLKLRMKSNAMF